jgi:hypothetical protein
MEFAMKIGIPKNKAEKQMAPFLQRQPFVETLARRSFLSDACKRGYYLMYQTRLNFLNEL